MRALLLTIGATFLGIVLGTPVEAQSTVWSGRVYDVSRQEFLNLNQVRFGLQGIEVLVLGEKHDTPQVQIEQARAIRRALESNPQYQNRWVLGWEFLNRRDQAEIDRFWKDYGLGRISGPELLDH
ncbi:MAG: ChaN family lipoprotein, partial [Bdellovibrionales bacterium]|nr:ChaN family lipoprotein [Bdellovibrionales bacterium]